MAGIDSIKKAVVGDAGTETIKSGTLVTTRGVGVVAVGLLGTFLLLDQFGDTGPWQDMTAASKLMFVVSAGAIWALVAAADSIARGIATSATMPCITPMPPGLVVTQTKGRDSPGWRVVAIRTGGRSDQVDFLLVKDERQVWVNADDIHFPVDSA